MGKVSEPRGVRVDESCCATENPQIAVRRDLRVNLFSPSPQYQVPIFSPLFRDRDPS